jgi:hypothetical protein
MERGFLAIALCLWAGTAAASDFDAKAAAGIVRIVVAGPENPDHMAIRDPGSAWDSLAMAFDGPYGIAKVAEQAEKTTNFTEFDAAMDDRKVQLGGEMKAAIVAAMKSDGYTIQDEASYNTDGALNVTLEKVWYNAAGFSAKLTPEVIVDIRFVNLNTHEIVFDKRYVYSNSGIFADLITPDARFAFDDYDAVLTDPDTAIAGLRAAIPLIANAIAADMRK